MPRPALPHPARRAQMAEHTRDHCRRRMVLCLQGCGMDMYAEKRDEHHVKFCDERYELCVLRCGRKIRARDKFEHMEHECVRRHAKR